MIINESYFNDKHNTEISVNDINPNNYNDIDTSNDIAELCHFEDKKYPFFIDFKFRNTSGTPDYIKVIKHVNNILENIFCLDMNKTYTRPLLMIVQSTHQLGLGRDISSINTTIEHKYDYNMIQEATAHINQNHRAYIIYTFNINNIKSTDILKMYKIFSRFGRGYSGSDFGISIHKNDNDVYLGSDEYTFYQYKDFHGANNDSTKIIPHPDYLEKMFNEFSTIDNYFYYHIFRYMFKKNWIIEILKQYNDSLKEYNSKEEYDGHIYDINLSNINKKVFYDLFCNRSLYDLNKDVIIDMSNDYYQQMREFESINDNVHIFLSYKSDSEHTYGKCININCMVGTKTFLYDFDESKSEALLLYSTTIFKNLRFNLKEDEEILDTAKITVLGMLMFGCKTIEELKNKLQLTDDEMYAFDVVKLSDLNNLLSQVMPEIQNILNKIYI